MPKQPDSRWPKIFRTPETRIPTIHRVFLGIPGLKSGWLTYIRLKNVPSAAGEKPWATEAWYTLNNISPSAPFSPTTLLAEAGAGRAGTLAVTLAGRDLLRVRLPHPGPYAVTVHDVRGELRGEARGQGGGEILVRLQGSMKGTLPVRGRGGSGEYHRLVAQP